MASFAGRASQSTARAGQRHAKHCGACLAAENHLVRSTGDDRFATFFIAIYDSFFANSALHKAGPFTGVLYLRRRRLALEVAAWCWA